MLHVKYNSIKLKKIQRQTSHKNNHEKRKLIFLKKFSLNIKKEQMIMQQKKIRNDYMK